MPVVSIEELLQGDRRALARALTAIENRDPEARGILKAIALHCGRAHRVGITGAPGVGKSALTSALVRAARAAGRRVGVLALDPSSPFSGGALLGDRIRMREHIGDAGVFVRSMASRGALGGLCAAAGDALDVFDAAGFDAVFIETVGVGQSEIEVAGECETTVVVLAPGAGDDIQAMKSGLLEVATLWVVNKADDPRAELVRSELIQALTLGRESEDIESRVLLTSAKSGDGVAALWERLEAGVQALEADGRRVAMRRERTLRRLRGVLREIVDAALPAADSVEARGLADAILRGERTTHGAAEDLLRRARQGSAASEGEEMRP
jgi:LAO/AO transport system kinase